MESRLNIQCGNAGTFLPVYFVMKIKKTAAVIGVISGVLIIGCISLSPFLLKSGSLSNYASNLHPSLSLVSGTMTIFIVGFFIGYILNKTYKKAAGD